MSGKNVNFGDKKNKKKWLYKNKNVAKIDDIDLNKILVSKEELYGTKNSLKCFIECNTTMSFKIIKDLLKKYNPIWKKLKVY